MSRQKPIHEREISYYLNAYASDESLTITIGDMIAHIKSDVNKNRIMKIRSTTDKKEREKLKKDLPAVTVSGQFPNGRKDDKIILPTNLMAVDIDHIEEQGYDIQTIKEAIGQDPHVYAVFITVSGHGLCAIVSFANGSDHRDTYLALDEYFNKNYGISIDSACKNESRLRFLCYDPDIIVNNRTSAFATPKKASNERRKPRPYIAADDDFSHVVKQVVEQRRDITDTYAQWRDISFAIADGLGESGRQIFQAISQFHPTYNERDTDIQYTRAIRARGSGVTKATFFHIARTHGLDIVSPKTKAISRIARIGLKTGAKAEDVVAKIQHDEGISADIAEPIVDTIYKANGKLVDGNSQDDLIRMVICNYADMRYNEITRKVEMDTKPIDDIMFNSLYIHVRSNVDGKPPTPDLIRSMIYSDMTPKFNPIKDFCDKAPKRLNTKEPKLIIDIANTLQLDDQDHLIAKKYVCLWLVSMAESWIRSAPNPYMLMLTGAQQGTGKTTFFRKLVPPELEEYYAEIKLSGSKDDALLATEKAIIMVDEMAGLHKTDWDWIKQILTQKTVTARPAYGRHSLDLPRLASWAGTSNQYQLLRDHSGTRRFLPLRIASIDREKYNEINKSDLMWEAVWLARNGWTSDLSIEEYNQINAHNKQFTEVSVEEELMIRFYMSPEADNLWPVVEKSATEISEYLEAKTGNVHKVKSNILGKILAQMGYKTEVKWIDGRAKRVYKLKEMP